MNIYAEFAEVVPNLMTKVVQKTFSEHGSTIESVVVTDLNSTPIE